MHNEAVFCLQVDMLKHDMVVNFTQLKRFVHLNVTLCHVTLGSMLKIGLLHCACSVFLLQPLTPIGSFGGGRCHDGGRLHDVSEAFMLHCACNACLLHCRWWHLRIGLQTWE
jgi:hypothetical protein